MILNEILEKRTKHLYGFDYSVYDHICPYCKYERIDDGESNDQSKLKSHFKSLFGANSKKWKDECIKWCENNKICDCFANYHND